MDYKSLLTKYKGIATSRGIIPNDEFMYCVVAIMEMGFDLDKNTARDLLECATTYYYETVLHDKESGEKSGASSSPDWITAKEHIDDNH